MSAPDAAFEALEERAAIQQFDGRQSRAAVEKHRADCEARYVAGLADDEARCDYLELVEKKRGAAAANGLRREAWRIMQGAKL